MAAMRRVLRIVVKAAAALWVLLLVASLVLWVRSYFVGTHIRHMGEDVIPSTSYFIWSVAGRLSLGRYEQTSRDPAIGGGRYPPGFSFERWDSRADPLRWPPGVAVNTLGFGAGHARRAEGEDYTLVVPYYAITLALLAPGLVWVGFWALQRRRRLGRGLCPICGYDLRESPGCCPECGTPRSEYE